jgi:hypothetical protein
LRFAGLPDSLLLPGDLHAASIVASPTNGTSYRFAILLHHSIVSDAVTFGPVLTQPAVTTIGTTPYLRLHAQLASQAEYNAAAHADFSQNGNSVGITTTAGYSGTTPSDWALDIPDLTSAGYDPVWGLKTGLKLDWEVLAVGGSALPLLGATPVDGGRALGASVSNTSSSFNRLRLFNRW